MGNFSFKCYNLCLFYVIFNWILLVACSTETYDYNNEDAYQLKELSLLTYTHDSHNIQKRHILPRIFLRKREITTTASPPHRITTEDAFNILLKKKFKKVEKTHTNARDTENVTDVNRLLQQTLTKNLGENGAGQRKIMVDGVSHPDLIHNISVDVQKMTNKTITIRDTALPSDFDTVEGEKKFNETLKENNITNAKRDENKFYKSTVYNDIKIGQHYWVNMSVRSDVKINEVLSDSHRRAATIKLSFEFPFYGHLIKNVTIATGGFLYTGDYVHSWLAATQYIAPLMANFDTSLSNDSFIKYIDNGTAFTVEWEKVTLQDKPNEGAFTFQLTLFKNGDIVFVYKEVPLLVDEIQELHHPVKVGLSDAYIMDKTVFLVRRKTIYEYDRVHLNKTDLKNWTTIYLKALPTCLDAQDCVSCLSRELVFKCQWCPVMNKCSEGYDRHRQDWLAHGCDLHSFSNVSICSAIPETNAYNNANVYSATNTDNNNDDGVKKMDEHDNNAKEGHKSISTRVGHDANEKVGVTGVMTVIFLIGVICGLVSWVFYAYRNPHTTSGQILIRYRPTQWRWRRGEARYTAATIHM